MKILLTGGSGQAGGELRKTLAPYGEIVIPARAELDLANTTSIVAAVRNFHPDLIVNAAAYTAVDKAEEERALCQAVNAIAPGILAEEAKKIGAAIIHYSTDYVFDGTTTTPYTETDKPNPLGVYGATKLAGEECVIATGVPHLIFRTCGLYAPGGQNFPNTMLRLATERDELRVVDDQIIAPTSAIALAEATAAVVARFANRDFLDSGGVREQSGVYNMTCSGKTTWFGFAREVINQGREKGMADLKARLSPIPTSAYPTLARRPLYSLLCGDKLSKTFDIRLPDWDFEVMRFISYGYMTG